MRQQLEVRSHLTALSFDDRLIICTIVRGEVCYGLERMPQGKRRQALETKAASLFAAMPCEAVLEAAADAYAQMKRAAERKGTPLDENDLWIAATAMSLGAVLVTDDSDFHRLPGLKVENWIQLRERTHRP